MKSLKCAPHEGDVHFITTDHGLDPYYAADSVYKDWGEKWNTEGKPTAEVEMNGERWALCFDYYKGGLDPWENPEFAIETVREYQFYFVSMDSPTYDGERADKSDRTKGGTVTLRPRWPNLTSGGEKVNVPDYGCPYVDAQVSASNIPHEDYPYFLRRILDSFGIAGWYFDDEYIHPDSNVIDLAYYVRGERDAFNRLHAPDGPIARIHNVIQGDRSGYRKHEEDHRKIPGYKVSAMVEDDRAGEIVKGHKLGKDIKHYYPEHPDSHSKDEALYYPKFEVAYQKSITDDTVYWDDLKSVRRELEETILNCLEWVDLAPTSDGDWIIDIDPYWPVEDTRETRKSVECPLPKIEDEQSARVSRIWGRMTDADRDVTAFLLSDGGKPSPQKAAEETGNTYRTVRTVIQRMEGLIRHSYGEMEIESKNVQQELLKRVRAAGDRFESEIESATMKLADAADGREASVWKQYARQVGLSVDTSRDDCRKLLRFGTVHEDRSDCAQTLRGLLNSLSPEEARKLEYGVKAVFETPQGREVFQQLSYSALKIHT